MSTPRKATTVSTSESKEQKSTHPQETVFENFSTEGVTCIVALDDTRWAFSVEDSTDVFYAEAKDPTRKVLYSTGYSSGDMFSIHPISKEYFAITCDKTALIWDIKQSKCIHQYYRAYDSGILYTPSSNSFIVAANGDICRLDSSARSRPRLASHVHARTILFHPSSKQYVTRSTSELSYWDENWKLISKEKQSDFTSGLIAIPDSNYIVSAKKNGDIKLWNVITKQLIDSISLAGDWTTLDCLPDKQHFIVSLKEDTYSSNSKLLLMKIDNAKLVNYGVICDNATHHNVRENGEIDIITSDSDKLRRIPVMAMLQNLNLQLQENLSTFSTDLTKIIAGYHSFFQPLTKKQAVQQENLQSPKPS